MTFEPNTSGAAAAYTHDSGIRGTGVCFRSCWFGDDSASVTGSWITWSGDALSVVGGQMQCSPLTTAITLDENSCHGISLLGMDFNTPSTAQTILATGSTSGHTSFVHIGGHVGSFTLGAYNTAPVGSLTDPGTGLALDSPSFTGTLSAPALSVAGAATAASLKSGSALSVNLLTAQLADFESAGSAVWGVNANTSAPLTSTVKASHGARSMALIATIAGTCSVFTDIAGITPGLTYTVMAEYSVSGASSRVFRTDLIFLDAGNATITNNIGVTATNSGAGWTQTHCTAVAPTGAVKARLVLRADTSNQGGAGEVYYVDQASLAQGSSLVWTAPSSATPFLLLDGQTIAQQATGNRVQLASLGSGTIDYNIDTGTGTGGHRWGAGNGGTVMSLTPNAGGNAALLSVATIAQPVAAQSLGVSGAVTIDASNGDAIITLAANATSSSITNPTTNQILRITFVQDATGGRTYAWPANCKFAASTAPNDTTASKRSTVTFRYDGANWQELGRAAAVG